MVPETDYGVLLTTSRSLSFLHPTRRAIIFAASSSSVEYSFKREASFIKAVFIAFEATILTVLFGCINIYLFGGQVLACVPPQKCPASEGDDPNAVSMGYLYSSVKKRESDGG